MENWKKGKERERERDTERVRRGRGRWRSGDWSRSSRGWGERRRIGKAIRSCLGLIPLLLRTPIPLAKSTLDLRSFSLSLSFFRSYYYSFLFPHTDKLNCFLAPAFLLLLFWHSHSHCGGVGGCNLQNKVRLWIFVGGVWKCETESTVMISWFSNFEKYMNLLFKE